MNEPSTYLAPPREFSSRALAAQVGGPVLVCYALLSLAAFEASGREGVLAVTIAALLISFSTLGSAWVASILVDAGQLLASVVFGMALRMVLPLIVLAAVYWQAGPLVDAGFVYYLIGFYLVALAADTRHFVGRLQAGMPAPGGCKRGG